MGGELSRNGRGGLRERVRDERMLRITRAAAELFAERGFGDVTTKEIARRAEVGEATLFRYAGSKFELLMRVTDKQVETVIDEIEATDAAAERGDARTYIDRIYDIYRRRSALYERDPDNTRALLLEAFAAQSPVQDRVSHTADRVIALVQRVIEEAQSAGELPTHLDSETVALNCNGTYSHEICRSAPRGLPVEMFSERLHRRLQAQLEPLLVSVSAPPAHGRPA